MLQGVKARIDEAGSAVVESLSAVLFVLVLVLGTIQVALSLYARNVVMSAVHDGARAAAEARSSDLLAVTAARATISRSAGSLVEDLHVIATTDVVQDRYVARVTASGRLAVLGPVPIAIPVKFQASTVREVFDESKS